MTTVYADPSALVRLLIDDAGSDLVAELWDRADAVLTSRLTAPEIAAFLAQAMRNGLCSETEYERAQSLWSRYLPGLRWVEITSTVTDAAAELATRYQLRAGDAIHVASATLVGPERLVILAWDEHVERAATAEGFRVVP